VRYAPADSPLYAIEKEARAARRGLWAIREPVPPWQSRQR
jgi:endonuclease YncB( thermonuclease family)